MKKILKTIVILTSSICITSAHASNSGSEGAMNNMVADALGAATGANYVATNSARCSTSFSACVRTMLGIAQIALIIQNLIGTKNDTLDPLAMGDMPQLPDYDNLCLDPSSGCTPDALDLSIMDTPIAEALKSGDVNKLVAAAQGVQSELDGYKSDLEAKGFTMDEAAGTLTTPDGQTRSLSSLASDPKNSLLPSDVKNALRDKMKGVISSGKSRGKVASTGGAAGVGGLRTIDELIDEDFSGRRGLASINKNKKNKNEDFLAAMADKAGEGAVGVAGDDIFKMIQRRYNKKKKSKEFIFR